MRRKNEENYFVNFTDYVFHYGDGYSGEFNGPTPEFNYITKQ